MQSRKWGAARNESGWEIRTWAPRAGTVALVFEGHDTACKKDAEGYWSANIQADAGADYMFRVDGVEMPDPASRRQAGDVHSSSVLHDHEAYSWRGIWEGRPWAEAVIYELHIGTFTPDGTFAAAADKLTELAALGITAIEVMPVGQWSGQRGWGYDGVLPFAPHPAYGTPDDFKAFVERAHELGMMVILDVVMNHFGPDGAYIHQSAPDFFNPDRHTPWGAAIDFSQAPVRAYWTECALMWLVDYHLDGLRLDAVHQIDGPGADNFFDDLGEAVAGLSLGRPLHLILEDERNEPDLREKAAIKASWNDDFHHAVHTAFTGESRDYYRSFSIDPIGDLVIAFESGHIEQGQEREGRDEPRGAPSGHLPPTAFVNAIQTHDQVGNRPHGERLITLADPAAVEVAFALLLISPYIPMIFMGEERGETAPFQFFADYRGEMGQMVREGRAAEFSGIAELGDDVPDPTALETFLASRIDWTESSHSKSWNTLTRNCLDFRARLVVPLLKSGRKVARAGRCGDRALEASWTFGAGTLHVAVNLGTIGKFSVDPNEAHFRLNDVEADPFALTAKVDYQ